MPSSVEFVENSNNATAFLLFRDGFKSDFSNDA